MKNIGSNIISMKFNWNSDFQEHQLIPMSSQGVPRAPKSSQELLPTAPNSSQEFPGTFILYTSEIRPGPDQGATSERPLPHTPTHSCLTTSHATPSAAAKASKRFPSHVCIHVLPQKYPRQASERRQKRSQKKRKRSLERSPRGHP